jgi:hypothetical protein
MKIYLIVILFVGLLATCESPRQKNKMPVVLDTTKLRLTKIEKLDSSYRQFFDYRIMYVGQIKDTILLPDTSNRRKFKETELSDLPRNSFGFDDSSTTSLFIDTNRRIYSKSFLRVIMIIPNQDLTKTTFPCYPLIITNQTKNDFYVGDDIDLSMEAQDSKGNWITEKKMIRFGCGTAGSIAKWLPNHIIIVPIPIYKGNFTTKLRVRLGKNVSNEYTGQINLEQFEKTQY